jgi:hypothetical protein
MSNAARDRNYSELIDELGLNIADLSTIDEIDLAALLATGDTLKSSASWLIGDVCLIAKEKFGDEWYTYIPFTVSIRTCNNYSSICRKFPRDRRRKSLPFRYFDAVKALDPKEQDEWLDKAIKDELSSDMLRDAIKGGTKQEVEHMDELIEVGVIDETLLNLFNLREGTVVRVIFEKAAA